MGSKNNSLPRKSSAHAESRGIVGKVYSGRNVKFSPEKQLRQLTIPETRSFSYLVLLANGITAAIFSELVILEGPKKTRLSPGRISQFFAQ
jgi:hypothetical protein